MRRYENIGTFYHQMYVSHSLQSALNSMKKVIQCLIQVFLAEKIICSISVFQFKNIKK